MPGLLRSRVFSKNCNLQHAVAKVIESSRLFRTLRFLWCPSHRQKLREYPLKSRGDLEKVGNRMVGIASINTG